MCPYWIVNLLGNLCWEKLIWSKFLLGVVNDFPKALLLSYHPGISIYQRFGKANLMCIYLPPNPFWTVICIKLPFFLCLGSIDEGVTEGLPTLQSTSGTNAPADDDDRYVPTWVPGVLHQVAAVINLPSLNPTMFSCSYIKFCVFIKVQSVPGGADALEECRWWKSQSAYSLLFVSCLFPGSTGEER